MATINLGAIKFKWQGAYDAGTAYTVDDVVSYQGSSYICILASTGNLPTNATYFEQMSQAGTDGTDLTTTLTTQGDILYRDGSGLQRLGAGTSGQVLQTNGTGANPSWQDAGGGASELLLSTSITSPVSELSIDGYFSSSYDVYKLYGDYVKLSSDQPLWLRVNVGGTKKSDALYQYIGSKNYLTSAGSSSTSIHSGLNLTHIKITDLDVTVIDGDHCSFQATIYNPLNSNNSYKHIETSSASINSSSAGVFSRIHRHVLSGGYFNRTVQLSGITITNPGVNFTGGNFYLYGFKNS